jgi:large subunit ribosomal protein L25
MKRLRQAGSIPAVLYGHGEGTIMLTVKEAELGKVIDQGSHIVELTGSVNESALIKDIHWDAFGSSILHLDLARVSATEEVEVTLPIELKGEAPGTHEGGVVKFLKHEVTILCRANQLPDKIELRINDLQLDNLISAGDIPMPPGVKLTSPAEEPIVSCAIAVEKPEEAEEGAEAAEPEVIGAKKEDEEAE